MTREEKIAELINIRDNFNYTLAPREVFDDAIKALEQEPCGDVISRQAVLDIIDSDWKYEGMEHYINELPSVNPQEPRTGRWIEHIERDDYNDHEDIWYECDQCHADSKKTSNYCPNCGANMG